MGGRFHTRPVAETGPESAAGAGLWVERAADTGRETVNTAVTARMVATLHPRRPNEGAGRPVSNGARKRTSAKRIAQAMTRLARIAVLVQNSSAVGPSSSTASTATMTPKTTLATGPSGTVLGSGTMNSAKINISGDVTR